MYSPTTWVRYFSPTTHNGSSLLQYSKRTKLKPYVPLKNAFILIIMYVHLLLCQYYSSAQIVPLLFFLRVKLVSSSDGGLWKYVILKVKKMVPWIWAGGATVTNTSSACLLSLKITHLLYPAIPGILSQCSVTMTGCHSPLGGSEALYSTFSNTSPSNGPETPSMWPPTPAFLLTARLWYKHAPPSACQFSVSNNFSEFYAKLITENINTCLLTNSKELWYKMPNSSILNLQAFISMLIDDLLADVQAPQAPQSSGTKGLGFAHTSSPNHSPSPRHLTVFLTGRDW